MGIDLIFRGDGREFETSFSLVEWDTFARLEALLPDAVAAVIGGSSTHLGEEEILSVVDILSGIERLDDFLKKQPSLLPDTFMFKREYILRDGSRFPIDEDFATGGMSGLELPGDPDHRYSIQAGLDKCHLTKIAMGLDGRGRFVDRRDLRDEEMIETITCGRIQIRKRSDHAGIREELSRIRKFLESLSGPEVTRTISG